MKTIAVINNKGGVGKTTTAVHLAAGVAREGRNVLLVDLDSQGSASLSLGIERSNLSPSTADVLLQEYSIKDALRSTERPTLDLLTGALDLSDADRVLSSSESRAKRLQEALDPVRELYDLVVIDCAPSTSTLTINALVTADTFIIPTSPQYLSLEGIVGLGELVTKVRRSIGEIGPILGILVTMVSQTEEARKTIRELREHYGGKIFDTVIRHDPAIEKASSRGQTVFGFDPDSTGAADHEAFISEVKDRLVRYGSMVERVQNKKRVQNKNDQEKNDQEKRKGSRRSKGQAQSERAATGER
jgi:chromosome partitioning protein